MTRILLKLLPFIVLAVGCGERSVTSRMYDNVPGHYSAWYDCKNCDRQVVIWTPNGQPLAPVADCPVCEVKGSAHPTHDSQR